VSNDGSPQRSAQKPSAFLSDAERASKSVRFYDFDRFRIDTKRHLLMRDGEPIAIKPKALDMLLLLVRHPGRLLGKEEVMNRLWPDTAVEEANLTQNVFVVRKALGEAPGEQRFIATVARQGYRFVGTVREVKEEPSSRDDALLGVARAESPPVPSRRWSLLSIGSAGLLLLAAGILAFSRPVNSSLAPKSESLSGGHLVRLTSTSGLNTDPALSPDGSLVACVRPRRHQRFRYLGASGCRRRPDSRDGPCERRRRAVVLCRWDTHRVFPSRDRWHLRRRCARGGTSTYRESRWRA
jgi:DNA-binding winged helix-turn-helix (wHTH) protein